MKETVHRSFVIAFVLEPLSGIPRAFWIFVEDLVTRGNSDIPAAQHRIQNSRILFRMSMEDSSCDSPSNFASGGSSVSTALLFLIFDSGYGELFYV